MAKKKKGKGVLELLLDYQKKPEDKGVLKELLKTAADELAQLPPEAGLSDKSWITCPEARQFIEHQNQMGATQEFLAHAGKCSFCRAHRREILHFNDKKISPRELAKLIKENL